MTLEIRQLADAIQMQATVHSVHDIPDYNPDLAEDENMMVVAVQLEGEPDTVYTGVAITAKAPNRPKQGDTVLVGMHEAMRLPTVKVQETEEAS